MDEKKKSIKKLYLNVKNIFLILYVSVFIVVIGYQIWTIFLLNRFSFLSHFYWLFALGWFGLLLDKRPKSDYSFSIGFKLFLVGALLTVVRVTAVGEIVMRFGFVLFLFGLIQAFIEFKKRNDKKTN